MQPEGRGGSGGQTRVSIPTGPFGPVQPDLYGKRLVVSMVSIPTGPFGPVQRQGQAGAGLQS